MGEIMHQTMRMQPWCFLLRICQKAQTGQEAIQIGAALKISEGSIMAEHG